MQTGLFSVYRRILTSPASWTQFQPTLRRCTVSWPHVAARSRARHDEHCINESDQADRAISTGKLHALQRFHTRPINVVVFHGSQGSTGFEVGFPLRCFQRLSRPYIATLLCRWRDNRSTRGTSIPVLSY